MSRRSLRAFAGAALVAAFALAWSAPGCKKEKESLIIVDMQARDANGAGITDTTIVVSKGGDVIVERNFVLPLSGLPMTPDSLEYGVYVAATGMLTVTVVARRGLECNGYIGMKVVKVIGGDSPKATVVMNPGDTCTATGTAGTGGSTGVGGGFGGGSGGAGGSTTSCGTTVGTRPASVAPPSLASCVDLDHNTAGACDPFTDTNNPIIYSMAVSPDGQLLVTSGWHYFTDDVSVKIWRFQGNTPVLCGPEFTALSIGPAYVAFSPDGKYLAIAPRHGYPVIFNVPSLSEVAEVRSAPGWIYGVGFSPDSQTLFTLDYDELSYDGNLYADRLDGTPIAQHAVGVDPDALAISPVASNGSVTLAVSGYIGNLGVYSFNGTSFSTTQIMTTAAVASSWGIGFSPDGQLLAAGADDGIVRFWSAPFTTNATSGASITLGSGTYTPSGIAFAPGGTYMGITFGPEVDIWNATTRSFVARHNTTLISGISSSPYAISVAFSASGHALISGEDLCGKVAFCSD